MSSLWNCTFDGNQTVAALCCAPDNVTTVSNPRRMSCNVSDTDAFGTCIDNRRQFISWWCAQPAPSAARPTVLLSPWRLVLVVLAFMASFTVAETVNTASGGDTLAAEHPWRRPASGYQGRLNTRREARCKQFDPDEQSAWSDAYTPSRRLSDNVACTQSTDPCRWETSEPLTATCTATWHAPAEVEVAIDPQTITAKVPGGPYAASVSTNFKFGLSVPSGQTGYVSTYCDALDIPGWLRDCGDGSEYRGSLLVPLRGAVNVVTV